ncbi:MAG TPA: CsbD family protein [Gemmatimonadaceae bacterium]|nr:CsbD family protein [Gemmatimonadaceae bacterium]
MNWDQIAGEWKNMKGRIREQWGELTDDDMDRIGGKKDQLVGTIQSKYGLAKEEAERQVEEFARKAEPKAGSRAGA